MQATSDLYKSILAGDHRKQIKAVIGGETYTESDGLLTAPTVTGALFETPGIGNCTARQIDIKILPRSEVPTQAKIQLFIRLVNETQQSEWLEKGTFYTAKRTGDQLTGVVELHGFDAMLKAEEKWLDSSYDQENWPMDPQTAAEDISGRIGIRLDSRTNLDPRFKVHYPVDGEGDMTMRQVLGWLAVANAGNWTITDMDTLLLVPLGSIPEETYHLVDENGSAITFGGVRILV